MITLYKDGKKIQSQDAAVMEYESPEEQQKNREEAAADETYQKAIREYFHLDRQEKAPAIKKTPDYNIHAFGAHTQTETDNDVSERLWSTLKGSAKSYAGQYLGTAGSAMEGAAVVNEQLYDQQTEQQRTAAKNSVDYWTKKMSEAATETERQTAQAQIDRNQRYLNALAGNKKDQTADVRTAAEKLYETSDKLGDSAGGDFASAKEGTGWLGGLAVDTIAAGTQMAADALLGGGSALIPMAVRSFGGGASQARDEGATYGQQMLYGAGSAAMSTITEKLSSVAAPFQKMFGKGILDEAIQKAAGKMLQNPVGKVALSFASEGAEEVIEDAVQPLLQKMTYDKDRTYTADDLANAINDGLVGGILGALGGGAEVIGNNVRTKQAFGQAQSEVDVEAGLADEALKIDPENKTALRAKKRTEEGETLSGGTLNKLIAQNESAFARQDKDAVKQAVANRLTELGETGNVDAVADAVTVRHSGQTMTREQSKALRNSRYGVRVANELLQGDITAGETGTNAENGAAEAPASAQEDEYAADVKLPGVENRGAVRAPWSVEVNNQTAAPNGWGIETEDAAPESVQTVETDTGSIERYAEKNGIQKEAMRKTYLPRQDPERYNMAYHAAWLLGKDGAEKGAAKKAGAVQYLSEGQFDIAYEAGKYAGGKTQTLGNLKEENQNGKEYGAGGNGKRTDGGNPGGEAGGVEARTGKVEEQGTGSDQKSRAAAIRNSVKAAGAPEVSTADFEVTGGSKRKTMRYVPEELLTEEQKETRNKAREDGVDIHFVTGQMEMENGVKARGAYHHGVMVVQVDNDTVGWEKITRHEEYHRAAERDPDLVERTLEKLSEKYGEEKLGYLASLYAAMYFTDETGSVAVDSEYIFEEILADAYADIDVTEGLDVMARATELKEETESGVKKAERKADKNAVLEENAGSGGDIRFSRENEEYLNAVKAGDMETAQKMVDEAAKAAGYNNDLSYKMQHTAPNPEDGDVSLDKLRESALIPNDYWDHPEWYTFSQAERESFSKVKDALRRKDAYEEKKSNAIPTIPVYRAVDKEKNKRETYFRNGDWVTPSLDYAREEGIRNPNGYRIIHAKVPINQLYWDGNSIAEMGFHDGKYYAYKDTANNRKLLDPVTYDNEGNVIPISKRFKQKNFDPRFSREYSAAAAENMEKMKSMNRALQKEMAYWKRKATGRVELRTSDVMKEAKNILGGVNSDLKPADVTDDMMSLYEYIANNGDGKNELTYAEMRRRAKEIAGKIVEKATVMVDESQAETWTNMKSYLKSIKIHVPENVWADLDHLGGWNDFRKKNMGTLNLVSKKDGMGIDEVTDEMADRWPEYFGDYKSTSTADQLIHLSDVARKMKNPEKINPYSYYMDEAINMTADELLAAYYNVREVNVSGSEAERADEKIARERIKNRETIQKLREGYQERIKNALAAERKRQDEDLEKRSEMEKKAKLRRRAEKMTYNLMNSLTTNTDKKHIPEMLKEPLADFLATVDLSSTTALRGRGMTRGDIGYAEALEKLQSAVEKQISYQNGDEENGEDLFNGYLDLPRGFSERVRAHAAAMRAAAGRTSETPVNRMNVEELEDLNMVLSVMTKSIGSINEMMANRRFGTVAKAAESTMTELSGLKSFDATMEKEKGFFSWQNTLPIYAFERMGKGGKSVFEAMQDGWDKLAFNTKQVMDATKKMYTPEEAREWSREIHEVELYDPDQSEKTKIKLTTAQIMSLYCLTKREQAVKHILGGGIRPETVEEKKRAPWKKKVAQTAHFSLTEDELASVLDLLTERQVQVADNMQQYMTKQGSAWGNSISMERFGYNFFGEKNYFPIETDQQDRAVKGNEQTKEMELYRLLNMSATKPLVKNANNAIMLRNIFDIYANHMTDMAKYNALALPILDAMKWYNYQTKTTNEDGQVHTRTVQRALNRAYGSEANRYFVQFMQDLNGKSESGRGEEFAKKMISRFKRAAVAANLRVALLQPTSIMRASAVLDYKYMAAAAGEKTSIKEAIREMQENSGIALWKSMGVFDTDVGRGVREQIKNTEGKLEKTVDATMKPAEWGDTVTWAILWKACKAEAKGKGVKEEELLQSAAEKFREVIYATQVVDSTMTRSDMMRGSSTFNKMMTSFMSEPTVSYNLCLHAAWNTSQDAKTMGMNAAVRKNAGKIASAFQAYAASAMLAAVFESLADALRDDDDYQNFIQKWWEALWGMDGNLISDLSPFNKLPVLRDAVSILEGYNNGRADTEGISSAVNAARAWIETVKLAAGEQEKATDATYNGKMTTYGKLFLTFKAMSQLSGLPVSSSMREASTIWNNTVGYKWPEMKLKTYDAGDEAEIQYAFKDGYIGEEEAQKLLEEKKGLDENEAYYKVQQWKEGTGYSRYEGLENAVAAGDKKAIAEQVKSLKDHEVEEKDIKSDLTKRFKPDYLAGSAEDRAAIRVALVSTGLYESADAVNKMCAAWLKK